MYLFEHSECVNVLLDLICYEMNCGRLSPEMRCVLDDHLARCSSCRKGIQDFMRILAAASSRHDGQMLVH